MAISQSRLLTQEDQASLSQLEVAQDLLKNGQEQWGLSKVRQLIIAISMQLTPVIKFFQRSFTKVDASQIVKPPLVSSRESIFEFVEDDESNSEASGPQNRDAGPNPPSTGSAASVKSTSEKYQTDVLSAPCLWVEPYSSKPATIGQPIGEESQISPIFGINSQRSDFHNFSVKDINPTKFIKEMNDDPSATISAIMSAYIGTEYVDNKVNFTMKKMYLGVQSGKGAYLYQLQINTIQKTTTLVKYFDRPAGNRILKIVGTKDKEGAEDINQLMYLETDKASNKIVLGIFLTHSKKFKSILSFPAHSTSISMTRYFRMNRKSNIANFLLDTKTYVVLFTVTTKPGVDWFSNVALQCCQITIASPTNKSSPQDQPADPSSNAIIEGFVTEIVSQEKNLLKAISVVATSDRQLHLYTVEYPNANQNRAISTPLGKYFINMNTLKETMTDDQKFDINTNNFVLNNMFLIPEMNNQLIMVYVAVNTDRRAYNAKLEFPRIDMLIFSTNIHPENKVKEDAYKDQKSRENSNSWQTVQTRSTASSTHLQPDPSKCDKQPDNITHLEMKNEILSEFIIGEFHAHRLSFNDRDTLGDKWESTKILIPEVKLVDNKKIAMLISSDTLKIQEMVVLDGNDLTHFTIKDGTGQGVASVDNMQIWTNKTDSSLHVLSQSISNSNKAIRDQNFDVRLTPPTLA